MTNGTPKLSRLLRPYWKRLTIAFAAMLVESAADLLEPWPLKIIFDYVIGSKKMPAWLAAALPDGVDRMTLLNLAALAVVVIAIVGAISSYSERYLSTTVGTRVGYDLRHMLYHHVQRLSLSFYEQRQTGDMVVRLTSDIDAAEELHHVRRCSAIALDLVTLAGMLCVMFYLDWRFSLIALSIAPILFVLVHRLRAPHQADRARRQEEGKRAGVGRAGVDRLRASREGVRA